MLQIASLQQWCCNFAADTKKFGLWCYRIREHAKTRQQSMKIAQLNPVTLKHNITVHGCERSAQPSSEM